jgi:hypothetical protein
MANNTASAVIDRIDEALKDDKFETRQGLRFMAAVLKEAMQVIGDVAETKGSTNTRLTHLEEGLDAFLKAQKERREKDETERNKWRWVIITPMAGYVLVEIIKWVFR